VWERYSAWVHGLLIGLNILVWSGVAVLVGWLFSRVPTALLVVVLASVVAFAVTPLVNLMARRLPRLLAILVAYLVAFLIVLVVIGVVVASTANDLSHLVRNLPAYARQAQGLRPLVLHLVQPLGIQESQLNDYQQRGLSYLQQLGGRAAGETLGAVQRLLNALVDAMLVLILSVYLTANGPHISRRLQGATRGQSRRSRELIRIVNQVVGGYVRGTVAMATLVGVLVGGGMAVLHVRYAVLLGVIAFFMEFIPLLGVIVSGALCVLIALFQGWLLALIVAGYFAAVHFVEGDLVGPRIMGRAVGIHPAVALVALVAGTELFGLWGALFGAPMAGLIQAIVTAIWRDVHLPQAGEAPPEESGRLPPVA
jgi:predicted PurR-regulated permease PerM